MDLSQKRIAQIVLVSLLLAGCLMVLLPFLAAILFAAVICIVTWPIYAWLRDKLRKRDGLSAFAMTLLLILVVLVPMIGLTAGLADGVSQAIDAFGPAFERGLPSHPPQWLATLPVIGESIDAYWNRLAESREELIKVLRQFSEPARKFALQIGTLFGQGLLQLTLVIFIAFFFYRDGAAIMGALRTGAQRLGGDLGTQMVDLAQNTVTGVMLGIVGTAFGQAVLALIGFLIAGVPGAVLLAAGTFFLSMIPVGPPLLWGGAAWWLYDQGETGWAIFMVVWGVAVISSVDNFLKPILISRSASLPILLIALGVFGGALAFGFIGIFLGPTLLALGHVLLQRWTMRERPALEMPTPLQQP
ncbi:MAG TPA: AI-2E family transporter [Rhodocyclaceae bacterium]|nr:AI-2E family transporter [Rhodocyclaceae bacterium]